VCEYIVTMATFVLMRYVNGRGTQDTYRMVDRFWGVSFLPHIVDLIVKLTRIRGLEIKQTTH